MWDQEHDSFLERFDRYLDVCAKHGIRVMVERHKDDPRVLMWNIYNEVGNTGRQDVTLPNLRKLFEIVRNVDPIQPLTCEIWSMAKEQTLEQITEVQRYAAENSDIISYHSYSDYLTNVHQIRQLKRYGRPIINTEWLARCLNNNVQEMFPLFYLENVGCFNWGFVAGKYQTYEPWNGIWEAYEKDSNLNWDFTKWFHDLFRPNHRPYDPKEIEIIKDCCRMADEDFRNRQREN